ncbi:MAG: hypothetical protein BGO59_09205 [Spirosoma sp. 48-14]|jgi:hypothetical protein|nr:MAG: hypothetical protein BGO59_09205 [Spirosoma sp. 48-14]
MTTLIVFSTACSTAPATEPLPNVPDQYEVRNIQYFLAPTDRIDTLTVQLKGINVQNPTNTLTTQQVEVTFDELVKTSQFSFDKTTPLPNQLDLTQIEVPVPRSWNGGNSFDFFSKKFPLSSIQQRQPYGANEKQTVAIKIPPKSSIAISRQIDSYLLTCSFQATIENKMTGQSFPLSGKWQGLLRYNNASTSLKESPL